jgi:endoribonuclease Dicer
MRVITNFVNKVNKDESLNSATFGLCIGECESENLEDVQVPKALGDVFESIAGAVYLDSGFSLDAVWKVYFRMMKPEIGNLSFNT